MRSEQNKQVMLTPAAQASTCAHKAPLLLLWDTFLVIATQPFNTRANVCATLAEDQADMSCTVGAAPPVL